MTKVPIKFLGMGEKLDRLEEFRPEIEHVVTCLERWYALVRAPSAPRIR